MSDVKWIKLFLDLFDNKKIKYLRSYQKGNDIVLLWIMILTIAGKSNADGKLCLTEKIPYTPFMIADEFGFREEFVKRSLRYFEELEMITYEGDFIKIDNWSEYQNNDKLSEIREYHRMKKREQRSRKKEQEVKENVPDIVPDKHENVMECPTTEEEVEEDIDIEYDDYIKDKLINRLTTDERKDLEAMCRVRMCSLADLIRYVEYKVSPNRIECPYEYLKGILEKDENWRV